MLPPGSVPLKQLQAPGALPAPIILLPQTAPGQPPQHEPLWPQPPPAPTAAQPPPQVPPPAAGKPAVSPAQAAAEPAAPIPKFFQEMEQWLRTSRSSGISEDEALASWANVISTRVSLPSCFSSFVDSHALKGFSSRPLPSSTPFSALAKLALKLPKGLTGYFFTLHEAEEDV